jgi:hypothetical protein
MYKYRYRYCTVRTRISSNTDYDSNLTNHCFFVCFSRSTVYNVGTLGTRLGNTLMSRGGVNGGGNGVNAVNAGGVSPARSPNGDFKNFDTTR